MTERSETTVRYSAFRAGLRSRRCSQTTSLVEDRNIGHIAT